MRLCTMSKSKLINYNGRFCESDFENAFISFLEQEGWTYMSGDKIVRANKKEVLIEKDLTDFLTSSNTELEVDEIQQIVDNVRLVGAETDFATLHKVYGWMVEGVNFTSKNGTTRNIPLIDFDKPKGNQPTKNIFRVVNQFSVEYVNNGRTKNRRPDVILYVNGMPLCVMELKNPADDKATIFDDDIGIFLKLLNFIFRHGWFLDGPAFGQLSEKILKFHNRNTKFFCLSGFTAVG